MRLSRVGGLIQNAVALITSSAISAIIGIVFWAVAARLETARVVGESSAALASMSILALLSQMSFGPTFERFIPVAGRRTHGLIIRAYVICTVSATIITVAFIASGIGHNFISASLPWRTVFLVSVVLWAIFGLQDSALVGLRSTRWVPVENITYSAAKLALLPLFVMWSAREGIFVAWNFPVIWLIVAVNWYIFRHRVPAHQLHSRPSEQLPSTRQLLTLSGAQYASLLVGVMASSITSLIVVDRLGAVANAHYYIPAQTAIGVSILITSIMRSFYVEVASEPERIREFARITFKSLTILLPPIIVIGVLFAPQFLGIFGHAYATQGATLLRMMLLSSPAMAVTTFYSAFAWLDKKVWWFALRELASAAIFFSVLLSLLGHLGLVAIGVASLVESGIEALFFLPRLIRRYRLAISEDI